MKILDYGIVLLVLVWFVAAVFRFVRVKRQGGSMCCGSCGSCSGGCRSTHAPGKADRSRKIN